MRLEARHLRRKAVLIDEDQAFGVTALAASNLHYDQRPGKASVAVAFGNFKGQSALAGGFGYAVSDRWRVNASFTASPDQGDFGATIGTSWTLN